MNANDVIEAYVKDVAVRLPRRQRNDVAFELRALLHEELQAKAAAAGRAADAAMATELARAFGSPEEVAARYRPALTIIDPADGHAFLRTSLVGLAILWIAGLLAQVRPLPDSGGAWLSALGRWWTGTVLPSPWWPGVLVVYFGLAAWSRRRPRASDWTPRASDHVPGGRAALGLALAGMACGVFVMLDPRWVLDTFFAGRAHPTAYAALTYTDAFREQQGRWLLALAALNVPIFVTAIAIGRWPAVMFRLQVALSLALCAVLAWTVAGGPVLMGPAGDRTMKGILVMLIGVTLLDLGIRAYRSVRPAPGRPMSAGRS